MTHPTSRDLKRASAALRAALMDEPLVIMFRVRNNKLDYSIMNRPEPNLDESVSDAVLMSALLDAGGRYDFKRCTSIASRSKPGARPAVARVDGRSVAYKESIEIDFAGEQVASSKGKDLTLRVLSIVVQNLARDVARLNDDFGAN